MHPYKIIFSQLVILKKIIVIVAILAVPFTPVIKSNCQSFSLSRENLRKHAFAVAEPTILIKGDRTNIMTYLSVINIYIIICPNNFSNIFFTYVVSIYNKNHNIMIKKIDELMPCCTGNWNIYRGY